MTDCCQDRANARKHGLFEGPVGDGWYLCECKKKSLKNMKPSTVEKIMKAIQNLK